MIIRIPSIAAAIALSAIVQILSGCSDSSAASAMKNVRNPATDDAMPDSTQDPAQGSGGIAGEDSGQGSDQMPTTNSDAAVDSERLSNLLTTGRNSDDSDSYWACDVNRGGETRDSFFARFWADGNGYLREQAFRWEVGMSGRVALTLDTATMTIDELRFEDEFVPFDRFTGVQASGERLDCRWGGPSRYVDLVPQADPTAGLQSFLAGSSGTRVWSCVVDQPDGSVITSALNYSPDNTGTGDKGAFSWYFDDDLLFMARGDGSEIDVFYEFAVINDDPAAAPLTFAAGTEDARVECMSEAQG